MLLSIDDARDAVLAAVPAPLPAEEIAIEDAGDRVLAAPVTAAAAVPPFASSAMDGYAVISGPAGRTLPVAQESRAGHPAPAPLDPATAARISTGAALPGGADTVVRQEETEERDGAVTLHVVAQPGANVRGPGEDLAAGAEVLAAGTRLGPAELAAAVAAGRATVPVRARPTVAILCTGDELRPPGAPLGPGEIHNSNLVGLAAHASRLGAVVTQTAIVPDDLATSERILSGALDSARVLVISGGVSVGPHDHVKPALEALGVTETFWRVALQPGKPTWFGTRDGSLVFGLPGNPVSALVTFVLFVRPALLALQGATEPPRGRAQLEAPARRNPDRDQAIRVELATRTDGTLVARSTGRQDSHMISSLVAADALAVIPRGEGELAAGTAVDLIEV
jgi:molybdopterin molybdotransferase